MDDSKGVTGVDAIPVKSKKTKIIQTVDKEDGSTDLSLKTCKPNNSFFIHDKSMMNNRLLPSVQMCPLVVNDESVNSFRISK